MGNQDRTTHARKRPNPAELRFKREKLRFKVKKCGAESKRRTVPNANQDRMEGAGETQNSAELRFKRKKAITKGGPGGPGGAQAPKVSSRC